MLFMVGAKSRLEAFAADDSNSVRDKILTQSGLVRQQVELLFAVRFRVESNLVGFKPCSSKSQALTLV